MAEPTPEQLAAYCREFADALTELSPFLVELRDILGRATFINRDPDRNPAEQFGAKYRSNSQFRWAWDHAEIIHQLQYAAQEKF